MEPPVAELFAPDDEGAVEHGAAGRIRGLLEAIDEVRELLGEPVLGLDEIGDARDVPVVHMGEGVVTFADAEPAEDGGPDGVRPLNGSDAGHPAGEGEDEEVGLGLPDIGEAVIVVRAHVDGRRGRAAPA